MFTSKRTLSFQVSFPAFHLARYSRKSVPGVSSPPSTWHGFSAKAFQVSLSAVHLARNPRKSVPGVFPRRPPGTESLQKCSRCPIALSTCHGFPAKVFQVSLPAVHLARNSCESVPGSFSCRPPATVFLQKRSRCLSPPSTWHGIPAKAFQVSFPAFHLARNPCKSVPGVLSLSPTWHGFSAKAFQVSLSAVHLPRNPCESVPGVSSCRPPGTVFPQKCTRCLFSAVHLARNSCESVPGSFSCRPPATVFLQKRSRWETSFGGFVHYVMSGLFSRTN